MPGQRLEINAVHKLTAEEAKLLAGQVDYVVEATVSNPATAAGGKAPNPLPGP